MSNEREVFPRLNEEQRQRVVLRVLEHDGSRLSQDCQDCAACCVAFSIEGKTNGERCPNLSGEGERFSCTIYEERPKACRDFDCRGMQPRKGRQRERIVELIAVQELLRNEPPK